jgi:hypothetical protein
VVQDKNQRADALSKIGSSRAQNPQGVFVQDIVKPSVGSDLVEKENSDALLVHNVQNATPTTNNAD